jgi:hypothetical protein
MPPGGKRCALAFPGLATLAAAATDRPPCCPKTVRQEHDDLTGDLLLTWPLLVTGIARHPPLGSNCKPCASVAHDRPQQTMPRETF